MTILLIFSVNAVLNFALGLILARLLGPDVFGQYGVGLALALIIVVAGFEWLRLCATRFYSDETRAVDPGVRATLGVGYAAVSGLIAVLLLLALAVGVERAMAAKLAVAATVAGVCIGVFDYMAALARARFLNRPYASLVAARNVLAFTLMIGAAWIFADPALVLLGWAASAIAAVLAFRPVFADPGAGPRRARRDLAAGFFRYAAPIMAGNIFYQMIPFLTRVGLSREFGYAEAGYLALAVETGFRIVVTIGAGLDMLLFQAVVRTDQRRGRAAAEAEVRRNIAVVTAIMLPLTVGLCFIAPALERLVVPPAFRGHFQNYLLIVAPAFLAHALVQYGLSQVFQLSRQTQRVIWAAAVALAAASLSLPLFLAQIGPSGAAASQTLGFGVGLFVLGTLVQRSLGLPWRDLVLALLATAAMSVALWPLRSLSPGVAQLAAMIALGGLVYGAIALLLDVAGARTRYLKQVWPARAAVAVD